MDTTLAPPRPAAAELERPAPTARRLAEASISPNTRRAYSGALRRLDAWLDGRPLEDAAYLAELHDQGRAPASAATAVAAACFRARLADDPTPAGKRTARVLAGYRRTAGSRGRGGRDRSGRRTWRPSSPPATGRDVEAEASSPRGSPSSVAASTR